MSTAKKVLGQSRPCHRCHIKTGTHQECMEEDGRIYDLSCWAIVQRKKEVIPSPVAAAEARQLAG